jgi:hypothetical protein
VDEFTQLWRELWDGLFIEDVGAFSCAFGKAFADEHADLHNTFRAFDPTQVFK